MKPSIFFITGCSRRFGYSLASHFLKQGHQVIAHYRSYTNEVDTLNKAGANILHADFNDTESVKILSHDIKKHTNHLDGIIHNASSFSPSANSIDDGIDQFKTFFNVHMLTPFIINETLKDLLKSSPQIHADIIHITDIYAQSPNPNYHTYCATKAGLENLMLSYAKSLAPKIKVNAIAPGPILFTEQHSIEEQELILQQTPLAKEGGLKPIIETVDFILTNTYLTGTTIKVDGGRSLTY